MRFSCQQDIFRAARQVLFVFFGERWDGEGIPTKGVGITNTGFKLTAYRLYPDKVQLRGNNAQIPNRGIIQCERQI